MPANAYESLSNQYPAIARITDENHHIAQAVVGLLKDIGRRPRSLRRSVRLGEAVVTDDAKVRVRIFE